MVKKDSLINDATGTKTTSQVAPPDKDKGKLKFTVKIDPVNFKFLTQEDGSLDIV